MLRTSAGTYASEKLHVRTHKMTDLSGITVTPGVLPAPLRYSLAGAVERIGGKLVETVRIDTTHFVCTEGRGREWERAVEMNIPVVRPEWVEGCEREGRIVGVRGYYLNADPRLRQVGQGVGSQGQSSRRTESQTSIKRMTPAVQSGEGAKHDPGLSTAGTDNSGISPGMSTNGGQSARMEVMPEPPTPPEKDRQPEPASTAAIIPGPEHEVTDESEEDEVETARAKDRHLHQPAQSRDLVQSPFDATHKAAAALPIRQEELQAKDEKDRKRQMSDGGSFSEVQL